MLRIVWFGLVWFRNYTWEFGFGILLRWKSISYCSVYEVTVSFIIMPDQFLGRRNLRSLQ